MGPRRAARRGEVGATAYPRCVDRPDPETLAWIAAAVALLALLLAAVAWRRLRVLDRQVRRLVAAGAPTTPEADRLTAVEEETVRLRAELSQALRHVAVVRYDAFGDMGGRLSFSAALLDDAGDGMVVSSIHARGESRTYAKGIVDGGSDVVLTPEERQALDAARTGEAG